MNMKPENTISMEQLRKLLHISNAKRVGCCKAVLFRAVCTLYSQDFICRQIYNGKLTAVKLSDTYCIPKSILIIFFASDDGFMIHHKSEWHKAVIRKFLEEQSRDK